MALKRNEKIGIFVAVVLALAFVVFTTGLFGSDDNFSLDDLGVGSSGEEVDAEGLIIEDVVVGNGEQAVPGTVVSVHYTGILENGTQFDTSRGNGPFTFSLGAGQVIKGWDQGVVGMRVGGIRMLSIPPDLAYGSKQVGPIPPNSTLIFEVELLEVATSN